MTSLLALSPVLALGWRWPGTLAAFMFFSFSVGAILRAPEITSLFMITAVALLLYRAILARTPLRITDVDLAFGAYLAWCSLAALWSVSDFARQELLNFIISIMSVYVLWKMVAAMDRPLAILTQFSVSMVFLAVLLIPLVFLEATALGGRIHVGSGPPVALSQPAPYIALCAVWLLFQRRPRHPLIVLLAIFATLLMGWLVMATGARGALVSTVAGFAGLLIFLRQSLLRLLTTLCLLALIAGLVLFAAAEFATGYTLSGRILDFTTYGSPTDQSSFARYEHFRLAWEAFVAHPLAGAGLGSYEAMTGLNYPHNLILEILAETGVIGLTATMCVAIVALRQMGRLPRTEGKELLIAMFIAALVHQQFSFEIAQAKGLLLVGFLAGATATLRAVPLGAATTEVAPFGRN